MILPVKNPRVTQIYGKVNPSYRKGYHTGIDLVADPSDKAIYNIKPGIVLKIGYDPKGWGNYVIVRQDDGHDVLYAHLYQVFVAENKRVALGDSIGIQGS